MTRVWIIDDELSMMAAETLVGDTHELAVTEPEGEAFLDALGSEWDLILVDEELWETEPRMPPQAVDGSSLVAAIRAWARKTQRILPSIAILTNKASVFADETPAVGAWRPVSDSFVDHEPLMGRTLDVEWLFTKQDENLEAKVKDLAGSLAKARESFGEGGTSLGELKAFLGLTDDLSWSSLTDAALRESRPPVTEDTPSGTVPQRGPVTVVVWLLQRALAFPGLFVSDNHAAAFLGIRSEALGKAIAANAGLAGCVYTGPLSSLVSRRWWAPALDRLVADTEASGKGLHEQLGIDAGDLLDFDDPVVAFDATLVEVGVVSASTAVRINPQGWPAECMQPWMKREDVAAAPRWMQEMVDPMDREGGEA